MILKKCENPKCGEYNLSDVCKKCKSQTKSPHYKFNGLRDAPAKFIQTKR